MSFLQHLDPVVTKVCSCPVDSRQNLKTLQPAKAYFWALICLSASWGSLLSCSALLRVTSTLSQNCASQLPAFSVHPWPCSYLLLVQPLPPVSHSDSAAVLMLLIPCSCLLKSQAQLLLLASQPQRGESNVLPFSCLVPSGFFCLRSLALYIWPSWHRILAHLHFIIWLQSCVCVYQWQPALQDWPQIPSQFWTSKSSSFWF